MIFVTKIIINSQTNKKMAEKNSTPILDFYRSLEQEPRGTMGKFVTWLVVNTGMSDAVVRVHLKNEDWSPIERKAIMEAIESGSWRNV
jgi:hypothetical protein